MQIRNIFTAFLALFAIVSCGPAETVVVEENKFGELTKLADYDSTEFLATPEHELNLEKNGIYAATLLLAWDEIRKEVGEPMIIDKSLNDLVLLNRSEAYKSTLKEEEYSVSTTVSDLAIVARAEFSKSLPFGIKLDSYNNELSFNGTKVAAFGIKDYNADIELHHAFSILYYRDSSDFVLKLTPKNYHHEIILFMDADKVYGSLSEMFDALNNKIVKGEDEMSNRNKAWRYDMTWNDEVLVPKLKFNIEHNYSNMEGNSLSTPTRNFTIKVMYQRISFLLDESGAEVESEAQIDFAMSMEMPAEQPEIPQPKSFRLDKPFLVVLKRTDRENPYFALWVANTELMTVTE